MTSEAPGLSSPYSLLLFSRRYYKETSGLKLDVGAYMRALEVPARGLPKPSSHLKAAGRFLVFLGKGVCSVSVLPFMFSK